MTELLEQAISELFKLPEEKQNAIASLIFAELSHTQALPKPTIAEMIDSLMLIQVESSIEIEIPERNNRLNPLLDEESWNF
jgi:hypothetical protein